jgi:hypothetical protein
MEVPFSSFHIPQVPNLIKSKTDGAKNKGRKTQECIGYLTLILKYLRGVMLHIIPLSSFYPPKIDVALEITIEFMINHYWILIQW